MRTHRSSRDEGSYSLDSLKERMTRAAEPTERGISTSPAGTWLDDLRTTFEPETGKQAERESKPKLLSGRLRSV